MRSRNVPQCLIEEARQRGIVPGAVVNNEYSHRYPDFVVPPYDEWIFTDDGRIEVETSVEIRTLLSRVYGWATVIPPAPSQSEGLNEGDAVECGPAMRAAIIELAKVLGIEAIDKASTGIVVCVDGAVVATFAHSPVCGKAKEKLTPEAFIAKMRVTAAQPKPIKIGDDTVKFNSDRSITVGCTTVSFATIEEVYNRLKKS